MTVAVTLSPSPILQFFGNDGRPLSGGTVETKVGSVDAPTYQDSAGSTPLPNPIPLNGRGEVSDLTGATRQLFLPTGTVYEFLIKDFKGNIVNDPLSISAGITAEQAAALTATVTDNPVLFSQKRTAAEIAAGVTPTNYSYFGEGGNVLNILRYGADPTGANACDSAVQSAITVLQNVKGGTIYFPAGTYKFVTGVTVTNTAQTGIAFVGDGFIPGTNTFALQGGTIFQWSGGTTGSPALLTVAGTSTSDQAGNVRVQGIGFTNASGAGTPTTGPIGIFFNQGRWHKVRDCYFTGFDVGIKASNTFMCKYEGIMGMACQYAGFWCDFGGEDSHFENCFFRYMTAGTSYGVFQEVSQNNVYTNCDFSNNPVGLSLFTANNGSISSAVVNGGIFENCTTAAIQMNDSGSTPDHYPRLMMRGGRIFKGTGGTTGIAAVVWAAIEVVGVQCNYDNFVDTTGGAGNYAPIILEDNVYTGSGSMVIGGLTVRRIKDPTYNKQTTVSAFTNSWVADSVPPYYFVDGENIVHLGGRMKSGVIASQAFVLPATFRPQANVQFAVDSNGAFGRVGIDTSGNVNATVGSNVYVALDGISYPVGG